MKALDVTRKISGTGFVGNEEIWICSILNESFLRQVTIDVLNDLLVDQLVVLLALARDDVILAPSKAPMICEIEVFIKICANFLRGERRADYQNARGNPHVLDAADRKTRIRHHWSAHF